MDVIPPLAMLGCGFLIAPLRRANGIGVTWVFLAVMGAILSWFSARSWDSALQAGFRIVDYGPGDERWAIVAGLLAAGTVATRYAAREAMNGTPAWISVPSRIEKTIIEAFLASAAAFIVFMFGGVGAGAGISRPVAASLATYVGFLLWRMLLHSRLGIAD